MASFLSALVAIGSSKDWLVTANLILSVLLALWMARYRRLYHRSVETQNRHADLIENLSEGIYRSSPDGRQLSANKALVELNGYSSEAEMLQGVKDIGEEWYVEPGRRQQFMRLLHRLERVEDFVSEIYRHKSRERIWVSESARLVKDARTGEPLFYEGSVREITATVKRLAADEQLQKLTNQLPGGLFQFTTHPDGSSDVHYISVGSERITGIPTHEVCAHPEAFSKLVIEADREEYFRSIEVAATTLEPWDHEFRLTARDGSEKWVHLVAHPEPSPGGITWHGYITDISTRKRQELEIEELAYYDPLTHLPNRRMFLRRMSRSIAECAKREDHGALLFVDLDNFKTLNDTQGHDIGDRYLADVAGRLRTCVSPRDTVARIGGDEFVVILEQVGKTPAEATRGAIMVAGRILASLREPFKFGELHHAGSASVGVVSFDGSEPGVEEVLKRADIAMYQAKTAGRNGVALFDPATMDRESDRYALLNELRGAFVDGQLKLHYQPQFDHERRIVGAEGLVRWHHPTRGVIHPPAIMPLVEQFGLHADLSKLVLEQGLKTLAQWQSDPRTAHLRLALNMSLQTIGSDGFIVMLAKQITKFGVDPRQLTFELIEHVTTKDLPRLAQQLRKLKEFGIRLSLDDFGTGYSSLTFLKSLPFDEVKIDGGFIRDIEKSDSDRALIKTMLSMARNLGLVSVAEHVENIRQEAYLRAFGCDHFQGFLYHKAVADADFLALAQSETPNLREERKRASS